MMSSYLNHCSVPPVTQLPTPWPPPVPSQSAGMGGSVAMEYSAKVTTNASGDPGDGKVVWNTAAQNTATHIFIDQVTVAKTDVGLLWREAQPRSLLIQRKTNTAVFANYTITAVVDNGGWFDLTVVPGSNAGLPFSGNDTLVVVLGPKPIA